MENYIAQLTFLIVGIGAVIASRRIKNPITKKAAYLTGWTALFLIAVTSLADIVTTAMAS